MSASPVATSQPGWEYVGLRRVYCLSFNPPRPPSPPRNKECPTCRKKLVSRRSLRRDSNFDALISKIYPSRDEYEAHQRRVLERLNRLHNKEALSSSIEEGLRQQARYRSERWGRDGGRGGGASRLSRPHFTG